MEVQYNFKIDETLRDLANELSADFENKSLFLEALLQNFKSSQLKSFDKSIDFDKYDVVETSTKDSLTIAFKRVLSLIENNHFYIKDIEAGLVGKKEQIENEKNDFKKEIEDLKNSHNEKILTLNDELKSKNDSIKKLEDEIKKLNSYIKDLSNENDSLKNIHKYQSNIVEELEKVKKDFDEYKKSNEIKLNEKDEVIKKLEKSQLELNYQISSKDERLNELNNKYLESYKSCKNLEDINKDLEKKLVVVEKEKDKQITILETKLEILSPKEELKNSEK